jgi:hypothetical protein
MKENKNKREGYLSCFTSLEGFDRYHFTIACTTRPRKLKRKRKEIVFIYLDGFGFWTATWRPNKKKEIRHELLFLLSFTRGNKATK